MREFYKGTHEHDPVEESEVSNRIQPPAADEVDIEELFEKCLSSEKVLSFKDQSYCRSFLESAAHLHTIGPPVFI